MPAEGRSFRWKGWRKGAGSREWLTPSTPGDEQQCRTSSHAQAKGTTLSGRRRQGVNRPDDAPAGGRKGASRVPRLATPDSSPRPGARARADPPEGEVVIARIAHEITLKCFHRATEDRIELQPRSSNPEHQPLVIDKTTSDWEIVGVVVGAMIGPRPTTGC